MVNKVYFLINYFSCTGIVKETWKPNIQFVIENDRLDETHIKSLANAVKIPQRRFFSYLLKQDLMNMVRCYFSILIILITLL